MGTFSTTARTGSVYKPFSNNFYPKPLSSDHACFVPQSIVPRDTEYAAVKWKRYFRLSWLIKDARLRTEASATSLLYKKLFIVGGSNGHARMGAPGNRTHNSWVASTMQYQLSYRTTDNNSQRYVSLKIRILVC